MIRNSQVLTINCQLVGIQLYHILKKMKIVSNCCININKTININNVQQKQSNIRIPSCIQYLYSGIS